MLFRRLQFGLDMFAPALVFLGLAEGFMKKKYIVRLTDEQRKICYPKISKLEGNGHKARFPRILCQVDTDGPNCTELNTVLARSRSRRRVTAPSARMRALCCSSHWRTAIGSLETRPTVARGAAR